MINAWKLELERAEKRLNVVETELVMKGYLNGWLIQNYEEEARLLRERIKVLRYD